MKNSWKVLSARIDALSLRERAFLFLSLIAVWVALADVLWVSPARTQHQQVTQKLAQQNAELQHLRDELKAVAGQPDPVRAAREEIAALGQSIATANRDIAELAASSKGTMTLPEVLVHFLRRHNGLTLVRTSNLAVDSVPGPAPAGAPNAAQVVRNGLELTVAGPYPELVRYVQTLESAMPALRWGSFKLVAEHQPPELSLQVFLLGPQP